MFDILFALYGRDRSIVLLEVNERLYAMLFRKAGDLAFAMLKRPANQIIGDADIKCSSRLAC